MKKTREPVNGCDVVLAGDVARHVSPEGQVHEIPIPAMLNLARDQLIDSRTGILPEGVRAVFRRGKHTIWVGEFKPTLRPVSWIESDSPVPFGRGTKYAVRTISLPFVVVLGVFDSGNLLPVNECFFRTSQLASENDELCFPSLLNVSRIRPSDGQPLAWICTQHLDFRRIAREPDEQQRMILGWQLLCETLWQDSYNLSSEAHEGASWYGESRGVDPRLNTIEEWEQASLQNWWFILDVPFLKTGLTLAQLVERIFANLKHPLPQPVAADMQRLIVNYSAPEKTMQRLDAPLITPVYAKTSSAEPWPEDPAFYLLASSGLFFCRNTGFFRSVVRARGRRPN